MLESVYSNLDVLIIEMLHRMRRPNLIQSLDDVLFALTYKKTVFCMSKLLMVSC